MAAHCNPQKTEAKKTETLGFGDRLADQNLPADEVFDLKCLPGCREVERATDDRSPLQVRGADLSPWWRRMRRSPGSSGRADPGRIRRSSFEKPVKSRNLSVQAAKDHGSDRT